MAVKDEILLKSIELFNQYDYESVTMRDIAQAMNKSVGNITYYFKKKSDLMSAVGDLIYNDFRAIEFTSELDINGLHIVLEEMMIFQKKYSFYFSNMIALRKYHGDASRRQVEIKEKLIALFVNVIRDFENRGLFNPLHNEKSCFYIAEGIVLIILSWKQQLDIDQVTNHDGLLEIIWNILYPNLTAKGIQQFNSCHVIY